jgi:hypothetical protein
MSDDAGFRRAQRAYESAEEFPPLSRAQKDELAEKIEDKRGELEDAIAELRDARRERADADAIEDAEAKVGRLAADVDELELELAQG